MLQSIERIIKAALTLFADSWQIMSERQRGSRYGWSYLTNFLNASEQWIRSEIWSRRNVLWFLGKLSIASLILGNYKISESEESANEAWRADVITTPTAMASNNLLETQLKNLRKQQ